MFKTKHITLVVITALLGLGLSGCQNIQKTPPHIPNSAPTSLTKLSYQTGQPAYTNINHGQATIKFKNFTTPHIHYANLDPLNRTSAGNRAYLDNRNVTNDQLRTIQTVKPTGWHQRFVNGQPIINRGHAIAYSLSKGIQVTGQYQPTTQAGDQNNLKNLFTQTAFSNQKIQTIFENKVRYALRQHQKVIYQVQPIFKGTNLMASGVHLQAISNTGQLNFNVYIYNVQPGTSFDYATGRSHADPHMVIPVPANAPSFNHDHIKPSRWN